MVWKLSPVLTSSHCYTWDKAAQTDGIVSLLQALREDQRRLPCLLALVKSANHHNKKSGGTGNDSWVLRQGFPREDYLILSSELVLVVGTSMSRRLTPMEKQASEDNCRFVGTCTCCSGPRCE